MRLLIQRVSEAKVIIEAKTHAEIGKGLLVLVGVAADDLKEDAERLAAKLTALRIFPDEAGKMNLSVQDIQGEIMLISQFTLFADTKKGNRPSFIRSAKPEMAIPLYEYLIERCEMILNKPVKRGVFGADMKVHMVNDGPVTIWMDSRSSD